MPRELCGPLSILLHELIQQGVRRNVDADLMVLPLADGQIKLPAVLAFPEHIGAVAAAAATFDLHSAGCQGRDARWGTDSPHDAQAHCSAHG